ncbi:tetratricopeptide repeat protein [bacterium]|nr:tetratricopeptide repeat protein [bacterium]
MKKVILLATILFVAVASTACINNLAVQDLNNKAQAYMDKGDYPQAIERLKSSIDLDSSIFETHYNLAVAYTKSDDYINAVEEYKKALALKPNSADVYYSLATTENNLAVDMEQGKVRMNVDDSLYTPKAEDMDLDSEPELTENEQQLVEELVDSAVKNYEKYLELNPDAEDREAVEAQIKALSEPKTPQPME